MADADWVLLCALALSAMLWHVLVVRLAPKLGLVKPNFRKKPIMASYGLVAHPYIVVLSVALWKMDYVSWSHTSLYLFVMSAMWVLGAIDDIWGSREVGGFRGHFRKLFRERQLTTGAVKAMGGGIVALAAGYALFPHDIVRLLLAAAVVALSSNILNLMDLRPGRAVAVLFAGLGVTYMVKHGRLVASPLIIAVAAVALVFGLADSRGRAMMGDSGSNSLGAALGITIALSAPQWMIPTLVALVTLHLYSEKRSISALIEGNRFLRAIDRCLGVR